jgi:hypothetical protein
MVFKEEMVVVAVVCSAAGFDPSTVCACGVDAEHKVGPRTASVGGGAVACEAAGDIECEFGPRTASADGDDAVVGGAAGNLKCESGPRATSDGGSADVAFDAAGEAERDSVSHIASDAAGVAAGVCVMLQAMTNMNSDHATQMPVVVLP